MGVPSLRLELPGLNERMPGPLERDDFSSNRHPALSFCLSMISGQTLRVCPEGKPVPTFPDHAPSGETKKPAAFFERRGLLMRSGNLGGKTDRITAAPGVAADLSIAGRPDPQIQWRLDSPSAGPPELSGHPLLELPDPPARHFIPRDDPESPASTPRPMRRSNRKFRMAGSA
jgi:hypothetical protein